MLLQSIDFFDSMTKMIEIIYLLTITNLGLLSLSIYLWRKAKLIKSRPESMELDEFLMDLLAGGGLVHVKRIAPTDIVLRARRK